jgi:hypothetical protein
LGLRRSAQRARQAQGSAGAPGDGARADRRSGAAGRATLRSGHGALRVCHASSGGPPTGARAAFRARQ